jgi:hypothetical protein
MRKLHFLKPRLVRPKFFLSTPLALLSVEIYLGIILGYFITKFCSGQEPGLPGKIKSFTFNIGNYKLHLHHWLLGFMILISALSLKFFPFLPQFSYGFLGGVIFQGVSCYPDWHKILSKQKYD